MAYRAYPSPYSVYNGQRQASYLPSNRGLTISRFGNVGSVSPFNAVPDFPSSPIPLFWLDGRAPMYVDNAGTIVASDRQSVRRVNDRVFGNWQTNIAYPGIRSTNSIDLEPAVVGSFFPLQSSGTPSPLNENAFTLIASWVQRDGPQTLALAATPSWGLLYGLIAAASGAPFALGPNFATVYNNKYSCYIIWDPIAGVFGKIKRNGVVVGTVSVPGPIAPSNPNAPEIVVGQFQSYAYCALSQLIGINQTLTPGQADVWLEAADGLQSPEAFPTSRPLLGICGTSIDVGSPGVDPYAAWRFRELKALRTPYDAEVADASLVGGNFGFDYVAMIAPFISPARKKQVVIVPLGTNDLAQPSATVGQCLTAYYAILDGIRALPGNKRIIAVTVLPRSGLLGVTQPQFDARRAAFNGDILTNWALHADAVADVSLIPNIGSNGDSANPIYYQADQVHLTDAGQGLLFGFYDPIIQNQMSLA